MPDALNPQAWNRYSYVGNDPLTFTDPTGHSWLSEFFHGISNAIRSLFERIPILRSIVQLVLTTVLSPLGPFGAALAAAIVTGLSGGKIGDIIRAAAIAGFTAGAFKVVGDITGHTPAFGTPAYAANVAGHAGVGCLSALASGGRCEQGALSGGLSAAAAPAISTASQGNVIGGVVASSVVGGLGSLAGGGKFENGAVTGAFGYLFNYCGYKGCFDRRFDWNDAVDQWRNGKGATVTGVQASELNLTDATYAKNPDESYLIHTSIKFDTGVIYGTVTGVLNPDGTLSFTPDTYNFDLKNPNSSDTWSEFGRLLVRDALTLVALGMNGFGTAYRIQFTGSIPAPKDLPR